MSHLVGVSSGMGIRGFLGGLLMVVLLTGCGGGVDIDAMERQTQQDLQNYVETDSTLSKYAITVYEVTLVHEADNRYVGYARLSARSGKPHQVAVTVIRDGDRGMWQTDRGAWLWLMDEKPASKPGY